MASFSFDLGLGRESHRSRSLPRLRPREWQSRLIQLLRARIVGAGPARRDVLIHAGPGAGKTLGSLLAFDQLRREGKVDRLLVFCHRSSIGRQWLEAARSLGITLGEGHPVEAGGEQEGLLFTYQAAARHLRRLREEIPHHLGGDGRWMAIADEVHHLGLDPEEPEAAAWAHAFTQLTTAADLRVGLSGTPFRADNLAFCAARRVIEEVNGHRLERIVPDLCVEPRRLILAGDVRPLEFRFLDGWVDHGREEADPERERSPLSAEHRQSWRARNLRRAIQLGDGGGIALRLLLQARRRLEQVRRTHPPAAGLVIARDIAHAHRITNLLREEGDSVHLVHSKDPDAAEHLRAFQAGEADWLVSVDMVAEGFDAPRLRVVVYLTTVVTRSRFLQGITRAVRIDGTRAAVEPIPRHPSYIYAPADPLLISFARHWSLSRPYLLQPRPDVQGGVPGSHAPGTLPLRALADDAGALIAVRGPELPRFLQRSA
jgi:superfamily II DNA or RNA helicase